MQELPSLISNSNLGNKKGQGSFCSKALFYPIQRESSIEKKVRYALQKAHINFLQEAKIGKYRADFLLPQHGVVIECDGDYWHQKPGIKERDDRKNEFLERNNYRIVRLPEKVIRETDSNNLRRKVSDIAGLPLLIQS